MPPAVGGALSDTAILLSVCPFVCPSLGYRHAGYLQLDTAGTRDVRTEYPSADGRRSAAIFGSDCHRRGAYRLAAPGAIYLVTGRISEEAIGPGDKFGRVRLPACFHCNFLTA